VCTICSAKRLCALFSTLQGIGIKWKQELAQTMCKHTYAVL